MFETESGVERQLLNWSIFKLVIARLTNRYWWVFRKLKRGQCQTRLFRKTLEGSAMIISFKEGIKIYSSQ